ncbi:MAG: polymer-forming cytoskeletal protein [Chlorobiota bacterium]|nr:MAG: polymer-forming cytoskeletal protein [Chlorobiota bacterium]
MKLKFAKKMYRPITVISSDVIIRGEVEGECDMRFDGELVGDIKSKSLVIEEGGVYKGRVEDGAEKPVAEEEPTPQESGLDTDNDKA